MSEPKHLHDSDCCTFLHHLVGAGIWSDREFDLYVCDRTLIARWSDDGPDYLATQVDYILDRRLATPDLDHPLNQAYLAAVLGGHV